MSLFSIARYTGEEKDGSSKQTQNEAAHILKQLQTEAKLRQQSIIHRNKHDAEAPKDSLSQKKGTHLEVAKTVDISDQKCEDDIKKSKNKRKKQKKEHSNDVQDDVTESKHLKQESDHESDNESKPKKKRKHLKQDKTSVVESETKVKLNGDSLLTDNDGSVKKDSHKSRHKKDGKANRIDTDVDKAAKETSDSETEDRDDDTEEKMEVKVEGDPDPIEKQDMIHTGPGSKQIGGFTVIGTTKQKQVKKVERVLPDWLSSPTLVSRDLKSDLVPVTEMPGLDPDLVQAVIKNGITSFFPVQSQVIPVLLHSAVTGFHLGRAGYRPNDICVSAPTGSGKTLAFVLPIVQALRSRVTCEVRALAVLPVKDLAGQVYKVFEEYCKGTNLKVGCLTGQKTFAMEQRQLVSRKLSGYRCAYDILVATPGRLVDHINKTEGFNLGHLRYLVIDEADRMMSEIKQDWLAQTEAAVYRARATPHSLTATNCAHPQIPIQKLLYSATLSQNPEQLQPLNLFQPKLFTSTAKGLVPIHNSLSRTADSTKITPEKSVPENQPVSLSREDLEKYITPTELTEYVIETTPERKPLVILHLLHNLGYRNVLCFTNSIDATHRLSCLLKLYGDIKVAELSSGFHVTRRDAIIQKFMAGKIDIIICSDVMARGIDMINVKYVVSYDPPIYIQTHIHRIGRTARAGKEGVALTLLLDKECFHFKKTMKQARKKVPRKMTVTKSELKPLQTRYEMALKELPNVLKVKVAKSDETEPVEPEQKNEEEINKTPTKRKHSKPENEKSPTQEGSDKKFTKLKTGVNDSEDTVDKMDDGSNNESERKQRKKGKKKRKKSETES